jgi:branched-subunit amino acid transport protein
MIEFYLPYMLFPAIFVIVMVKYWRFLFDILVLQRKLPQHMDVLLSFAWIVAFIGLAVMPLLITVISFWIYKHAGAETGIEGALGAATAITLAFAFWVVQCSMATTCRCLRRMERV